MVQAINSKGMIGEFSDKVWKMMSKNHNGWVEFNGTTPINVPKEVTEFMAKKKDAAAEGIIINLPPPDFASGGTITGTENVDLLTEDDAAALQEQEMEEMRKFLKEKNVMFHPKMGYAKLKNLYDDYSK